jgi:hypothetical protein
MEQVSSEQSLFIGIISHFDGVFPELGGAIENKDAVAIADCVNYELLPVIDTLHELIKKTIDDKVVRPYVS